MAGGVAGGSREQRGLIGPEDTATKGLDTYGPSMDVPGDGDITDQIGSRDVRDASVYGLPMQKWVGGENFKPHKYAKDAPHS